MAEVITSPKPKYVLSPDAVKAIEKILALGNNAKVSTGKSGVTVYEENVTKAYSQP